jgi:transketolase
LNDIAHLKEIATTARIDCLKTIHKAKSGHPGGSMSAMDILTVLYFHTLRIDPKNPTWPDRDRFILGQYLSVGAGMALAGRMDGKDYKVYVLLGDGELQEGQVWEAAMASAGFELGRLIAIVDKNKVQQSGPTDEIMRLGDVEAKFRAFGWKVVRIDGHDIKQIVDALDAIPDQPRGAPTIIIADTIKGKGVSFMEGKAEWHGGAPSDDQLAQALAELGGTK